MAKLNSSEKERIMSNLEELDNAYNTIELYGDAITEAIELIDDCAKIVHCVNCKNRMTSNCPVCVSKPYLDDDWYCADGESW